MRRCSELSATASKRGRSTNGLLDSAVFDQEMELDDQVHDGDGWEVEGMEIEDSETAAKSKELLTEAVQYGQQLFIDYPPDERGGDRKMLEDIFSLVAYQDARQSVHGHYLDPANRIAVAEELNSAILGKQTGDHGWVAALGYAVANNSKQCPSASHRRRRWSACTNRRRCW